MHEDCNYEVEVLVNVHHAKDEPPLSITEIGRRGWREVLNLEAPVVTVIMPDGTRIDVDLEGELD